MNYRLTSYDNASQNKWPSVRRSCAKLGAVVTSVALVSATAFPVQALADSTDDAAVQQATSQQGPGGGNGTTPPDKPDGSSDGNGGPGGGGAPDGNGTPGGGANTTTFDYSGSYSGTLVADGETVSAQGSTYAATGSSTNVALAENAGQLAIDGSTLTKSGDTNDGDTCNFYGVNSIALSVNEGSLLTLANATLSATSEGSNGVFATDSATAYVYNSSISTTAGNSRGLDATYGGTIIADEVDVITQGDHCAGIATDRGGGYVSASDSEFSTSGSGSPLLYSTGCIEVDGVTGTATGSQIAGMEGLNTIRIEDSDLTSTITSKTASDPIANGVIIYQSTSGDADTSTGSRALFQAVDSTLTSSIASGAMFYLTNTSADIVLSGTTLNFDSSAANLLTAAGNDSNSWGSAGSNGADVTLSAYDETLNGNIDVDAISSLDLYLTEASTYTGAINSVANESGATGDGEINVTLDSGSTWVVTGDSTISSLSAANGASIVDASGQSVTIVAGGQTMVSGTSGVTITVSGSYSTTADVSGAVAVTDASIDCSDFNEYFGIDDGGEVVSDVVERLAGNEAEDTSAAISAEAFESADWAILATNQDFADAMSATGLAGVLNAPILLTDPNELSECVLEELQRLGVKNVYIIGGNVAMPADFETALANAGITGTVERVYGAEYYDTSVACAEKIVEHGGDCTKAIVAYGENFQDALSISSFAYKYGVPILLETSGETSADRALSSEAQSLLATGYYADAAVYVPGGTGAVSEDSVEGVVGTDLRGGARIGGETGYDTSNLLAVYMTANGYLEADGACIATGAEAAKGLDALSGAALAGSNGSVMLLVSAQAQMEAEDYTTIDGYLSDNAESVESAYLLGGTYVLPKAFLKKVDALLS